MIWVTMRVVMADARPWWRGDAKTHDEHTKTKSSGRGRMAWDLSTVTKIIEHTFLVVYY